MANDPTIQKRLQEFLISLDFFAIQPNLNVFKKQKYSTSLGALMTLCIGFITIGYLAIELQELVSKSLPNVIQSEKQVVETSSFPLMQNNFTLAVSVTNSNLDPIKKINQYYTITIKNCVRTRKLNATTQQIEVNNVCTTYPTDACTKDDFVTDTQKQFFNKTRLGTVQCIKRDLLQSNPPKLKGIASGNEYAYITIYFSMCKNTTNMQTCAPQEEILAGLSSGFYTVYLSDTLIQMGNRGNISQDITDIIMKLTLLFPNLIQIQWSKEINIPCYIMKLQFTPFAKSSSLTIQQTFRIIESLTDVGIITSSLVQDYNLIQQNIKEQSSLYNDEYLIYHSIILDDKFTQYQRTYIKLQAILSKIGGLWQILFLMIWLNIYINHATFLKPFIETDMYLRICNSIFRIEKEDVKNKYDGNKTKSHVSKMVEELNPKFNNSILEIILITLNCKRKKKSHLQLAKTAFFSKIDVVELAFKSFQQDQLKQILLTEDQRRLFDCIPRPFIHFDKGDQMDFFIQSKRINEAISTNRQIEANEQFLEACKFYFKIIQNFQEIHEVDKRLLGYLDQDTIQLFNQLNFTRNKSQFDISFDFSNKRSISVDQRNQGLESQNCLTPISLESPAARVLHINKNH